MVKKKDLTIEDLADLMQKGFTQSDNRHDNLVAEMRQGFANVIKDTDSKIENLAVMVQTGFEETRSDITRLDRRIDGVEKRFDNVDQRLDRIENILTAGLERRVERLEDGMRQTKTALKIK